MPVIARYAIVTLVPFVLIFIGATIWGGAAVLALLWLTVLAAGLDKILSPPPRDFDDRAPWSDRLSLALGVGHLLLLPVVLVALAGPDLSFGARVALFFAAASFFGQVSHPNAHELIHRRERWLPGVGAAVYTSLGFGHHVSAHRLVHHRYVGTDRDPNTPLPGESFWAYLPRAWQGSFEAGLACENERLTRRGLSIKSPRHPYVVWVGGAVFSLLLAGYVAGPIGMVALLALSGLMGAQILLSDYIQHYGLQRLELPSGRVEPVGAHHSWNAPRGFSSYLMMNAPAHSEHHMHPDRPYDRLDPEASVPTLPFSLPVMGMIAMVPQIWHRMMDKRALRVMEAAQARVAKGVRPAPIGQAAPNPKLAAAPPQVEKTQAQATKAKPQRKIKEAAPDRAAESPVQHEPDADDAALLARVTRAAE